MPGDVARKFMSEVTVYLMCRCREKTCHLCALMLHIVQANESAFCVFPLPSTLIYPRTVWSEFKLWFKKKSLFDLHGVLSGPTVKGPVLSGL